MCYKCDRHIRYNVSSGNILLSWYSDNIGKSTTDDEVYGYYLFVAGIVLGAVGLTLFYAAAPRSGLR